MTAYSIPSHSPIESAMPHALKGIDAKIRRTTVPGARSFSLRMRETQNSTDLWMQRSDSGWQAILSKDRNIRLQWIGHDLCLLCDRYPVTCVSTNLLKYGAWM